MFHATSKHAVMPTRATSQSAGYDLSVPLNQSVTVPAGGSCALVDLGLTVNIPDGHVGQIYVRSSVGVKMGIGLANGTGIIDADYEGPLMVGLINRGDKDVVLEAGSRIAQMVMTPFVTFGDQPNTKRGTGGFGSTGG